MVHFTFYLESYCLIFMANSIKRENNRFISLILAVNSFNTYKTNSLGNSLPFSAEFKNEYSHITILL